MAQALLAQDVVVLAKLISLAGERPPIAQLAGDVGLSPSQTHLSLKRLERARLLDAETGRPVFRAVEEFLVHAVKYVFPAARGEVTRGLPTAYAAAPLKSHIASGADLPPVWPHPEGTVRGVTLEPVHRTAPGAAAKDPTVYKLLALADAIRDGRARERTLAERELNALLKERLRG